MSVIVFDGKTVAADKQATNHGVMIRSTKIEITPEGVILGAVGDMSGGAAMKAWFKMGMPADQFPNKGREPRDATWLIAVYPDGKVLEWQMQPTPIIHDTPQKLAWGSGMSAAFGALWAGCSAREAVEIASKVEDSCGMGVDVIELPHVPASHGA